MNFAGFFSIRSNFSSTGEEELVERTNSLSSNTGEDGSVKSELSSHSGETDGHLYKVESDLESVSHESMTSSSYSGSATPPEVRRPLKSLNSDVDTCDYCKLKVAEEDCKICRCGTICCDGCYESVFRCGHLCEYTCEDCCERGVYCNRRAILQCEACSYDHHQRCGCDYINTPDESSDDEVYQKCDYCIAENGISSMRRCKCGTYCCEECFPKVEKCGYECDFTCMDCCHGVYCFKENYPQCKNCAEDHLERCGCNDDYSGTGEVSSDSAHSESNSVEIDSGGSEEDSEISYTDIIL